MLHVAPTELRHTPFKKLAKRGRGSGKCEERGCDFAFKHDGEWYGVQRKEIKDFVNSVNDKRLAKEVQQMRAGLAQGVLLIEGQVRWSLDGHLVVGGWHGHTNWTREKHLATLMSVQDSGIWVLGSNDPANSAEVILAFKKWVEKGRHTSLLQREGMRSLWGRHDNMDFQRHVLMSWPMVGVEKADAFLRHFGELPLRWNITREQIMEVPGWGPGLADRLLGGLREDG